MANGTQYSFQRIEKKYFISPAQMEALLNVMRQHMTADRYGEYAIGNIYCDTDNFRLIRARWKSPPIKKSCASAATACQRRGIRSLWS